ncbi:PepSY-associated TM helix domain-containing protein [Hydrogenimonas sp.]
MVKLFKLHKLAGLLAGGVLFLLGVTGFFLDHDNWRFLYTTTLPCCAERLAHHETRLFEGYRIDPDDPSHRIACGKRGIFESFNGGQNFQKILTLQCNGLRESGGLLYAATDEGVYRRVNGRWEPLALRGNFVNALAVYEGRILAAVEKEGLVLLDAHTGETLRRGTAHPDSEDLRKPVTLARFVRDLHYGRGLFDGDASLLLNDYGGLVLAYLALSGYVLWWLIHRKKAGRKARTFVKTHANLSALMAGLPLVILAVTGIFLDHARALGGFMRSVTVPAALLPPVYSTLRADIWSVDYDGRTFRVGNRYGVFASDDMTTWRPENAGFAYRMFRKGETLYVSGMGAPNRVLKNGRWRVLPKTPHMFKDLQQTDGRLHYFSTHHPTVTLPTFGDITLYTLLLSLHDGSFFAPWWVWVNDAAALLMMLLLVTGSVRWWARKRRR